MTGVRIRGVVDVSVDVFVVGMVVCVVRHGVVLGVRGLDNL